MSYDLTKKFFTQKNYTWNLWIFINSCLIIGKEFEVLIDSHGPEHVTQLMQKVISSLEHLEKLAALGDEERDTIENLKTTITHLELEGTKKNEERQRNSMVNFLLICLLLSFLEKVLRIQIGVFKPISIITSQKKISESAAKKFGMIFWKL